ncbi:hypothetical protein THAOC_04095, partial [Thalassiosira oceanica]
AMGAVIRPPGEAMEELDSLSCCCAIVPAEPTGCSVTANYRHEDVAQGRWDNLVLKALLVLMQDFLSASLLGDIVMTIFGCEVCHFGPFLYLALLYFEGVGEVLQYARDARRFNHKSNFTMWIYPRKISNIDWRSSRLLPTERKGVRWRVVPSMLAGTASSLSALEVVGFLRSIGRNKLFFPPAHPQVCYWKLVELGASLLDSFELEMDWFSTDVLHRPRGWMEPLRRHLATSPVHSTPSFSQIRKADLAGSSSWLTSNPKCLGSHYGPLMNFFPVCDLPSQTRERCSGRRRGLSCSDECPLNADGSIGSVRGLRQPQTTIDASLIVDMSSPMCLRPSHEMFFMSHVSLLPAFDVAGKQILQNRVQTPPRERHCLGGISARFAIMSTVETAATGFNDLVGCRLVGRSTSYPMTGAQTVKKTP